MEVIAVLMGVFFGVIISSASYVMGRINARKEMREVYNEAADFATNQQCDG